MKKPNSLLLFATFFWKNKRAFLSNVSLQLHTLCDVNHVANQNIYRYNRTINDLMKSGSLDSAVKLFDEMPERDVITWNIMVSGHYRFGFLKDSLRLYSQMVSQWIAENPSTFSTVLSLCSCARFFEEGLVVHCRAIVLGFSNNVYIGSSLIDLYLQMGLTDIALRLFSTLQERNLATWNVVLRGLCEVRRSKDSLTLYNEMRLDDVEPNGLSFCYLIQGCGYERLLDEGMQLHCRVIKNGWVNSILFVPNALVDFYSACGSLIETRKIFEVIPQEDIISWNSMVSVCAANGCSSDAVEIFWRMRFWGKKPSICSFLGFLKLSSATENISFGKQTHCCVLKLGFDTILVRSALIDMYGKCGDIESSVSVFHQFHSPNVICFTSIISALARNGMGRECLQVFDEMTQRGLRPDKVTFLSVLTGCNHSGLVEEGRLIFYSMPTHYGLYPERQHYACMIDLLGRAGLLDEAEQLLKDSSWGGDYVIWSSVLRSCRIHQNERVGKRAAKMLTDIGPESPTGWLQASSFYSDICDFENAKQCREIAVARKVRREIGWSLIEARGDQH